MTHFYRHSLADPTKFQIKDEETVLRKRMMRMYFLPWVIGALVGNHGTASV